MTAGFLDTFKGEQIGWENGRAVWKTLAPLRYRSVLLGGRVILIPTEDITDHASVPRVPLAYLLTGGRGIRSATIHDFPYQFGYWLLEDGTRLTVDKPTTDAVFHESLPADPISGAGPTMAWTMFQAVSHFGHGHWNDQGARAAKLNPIWTAEGWLAPAGAQSP